MTKIELMQQRKSRREILKIQLRKCNHFQQVLFVRMYGPAEQRTDKFMYDPDMLAKYHLSEIIDKMPSEQLPHAIVQVARTIEKNDAKKNN